MARLQTTNSWYSMSFNQRLRNLRKKRGLTQKTLGELTKTHTTQIQRYESGDTLPTVTALRKLALALNVTSDELVFDKDERGPQADDLKLTFEAINNFDPQEKLIAKRVLQGLILQHQNKHLADLMQSDEDNLVLTEQAS